MSATDGGLRRDKRGTQWKPRRLRPPGRSGQSAHLRLLADTDRPLLGLQLLGASSAMGLSRPGSPWSRCPALSGVTAIAAGDSHTCALLADTTVRCWGYNWGGPARRRDDGHTESALSRSSASLGRHRDHCASRIPNVRPARRHDRPLLGLQRPRRARRRDDGGPAVPSRSRSRASRGVKHPQRRHLPYVRPPRRRHCRLLGRQRQRPARRWDGDESAAVRPRSRASRGAVNRDFIAGDSPYVRSFSPTPPSAAGAQTAPASSVTGRGGTQRLSPVAVDGPLRRRARSPPATGTRAPFSRSRQRPLLGAQNGVRSARRRERRRPGSPRSR